MHQLADLVQRVETEYPEADKRDIARVCLVLMNEAGGDVATLLEDDASLFELWSRMELRVRQQAEQHSGMCLDLEALARRSGHEGFRAEEAIPVLMRAIRQQSGMLSLYLNTGVEA